MCGIAGIVDRSLAEEEAARLVTRMVATLVHRGPDDDGFLTAPGVGLGMRRLSIIDVAGGHQPVGNEDGTVAVIQNGEIYNFRRLQAELAASGHTFATGADTEVIVHAYEEDGVDAVARLHGMFGLAVWDSRRQRLLLARDRLGKKPLYYAHDGERLVFGSEIKALLTVDPALGEQDDDSLLPYLRYGFVPEPRTMYSRIRSLAPGHLLTFAAGRLVILPYWQLDLASHVAADGDFASRVEELDALLGDAVSSRLVSEVPLGLFLSGGLDSSAIAAHAARSAGGPVKTFTIAFDRPGWDESADAALVAQHLGTEHHVLTLREREIERTLPETVFSLVRHFDGPFGDPSALPTFYVSKLAREHVTVILGGDGADVLFAGYSTYRGIAFAERYRRLPGSGALARTMDGASRALPRGRRYRVQHAARVLSDSALPFEDLYFRKKTILRQPDLTRLLTRDLAPAIAASEPPASIPADILSALGSSAGWIDRMSYADLRFGLLNDMLVKVDRMSMANSLEVRSPFLDHRIVEFALRLPPRWKLKGRETKVILRETLRGSLPQPTLRKPKQGFNVPLREWFRGSLGTLAEELLLGGSLPAETFNRPALADTLRRHRNGDADHSSEIWLLMSLAAWRETARRAPDADAVAYEPKPTAAHLTPEQLGA